MRVALHKQARTTPAVRAEIAQSQDSIRELARRCLVLSAVEGNVTEATIRKWKSRTEFNDLPHTAHRLQTTLTPAQEAIVVYLRKTLVLPLDDLLAVTREFLTPAASRSGHDRCLRRQGVGCRRDLLPLSRRRRPRRLRPTLRARSSRPITSIRPWIWSRPCTGRSPSTTLHLPQAALGSQTPIQSMNAWYKTHPDLLHRRIYDRPECDSLGGSAMVTLRS